MGDNNKTALLVLTCCLIAVSFCTAASASTTEVHAIKYSPDKTTILGEKTITCQWMEQNLPIFGDGMTHYYHQGPVFIDDPNPDRKQDLRWNAAEDKNVQEKDMGAVKGSAIRDLCELVGGMQPGDTLSLKAEDGFSKIFAYENVYVPPTRQGQMILTWYKADVGYVPTYQEGMRLVFFADNSTNPWGIHAFGNYDWHESADPEYWYYYQQGQPPEKYPTTTGLSVQYVSDMIISSNDVTGEKSPTPDVTLIQKTPLSPLIGIAALSIAGMIAGIRGQSFENYAGHVNISGKDR